MELSLLAGYKHIQNLKEGEREGERGERGERERERERGKLENREGGWRGGRVLHNTS